MIVMLASVLCENVLCLPNQRTSNVTKHLQKYLALSPWYLLTTSIRLIGIRCSRQDEVELSCFASVLLSSGAFTSLISSFCVWRVFLSSCVRIFLLVLEPLGAEGFPSSSQHGRGRTQSLECKNGN